MTTPLRLSFDVDCPPAARVHGLDVEDRDAGGRATTP